MYRRRCWIRFCRHSDFKTSVVARTRERPQSHSEPDRCSHETMGCLRRAHRLCGESDVVTAPHSNFLAACVSFACTRCSSGCGIVGAGGFRTTFSQTVLYSLATSLTIWGPSKPRCFALHRSSRYVAVRLLHTEELLSLGSTCTWVLLVGQFDKTVTLEERAKACAPVCSACLLCARQS